MFRIWKGTHTYGAFCSGVFRHKSETTNSPLVGLIADVPPCLRVRTTVISKNFGFRNKKRTICIRSLKIEYFDVTERPSFREKISGEDRYHRAVFGPSQSLRSRLTRPASVAVGINLDVGPIVPLGG